MLKLLKERVNNFQDDINSLLSKHEGAQVRVITISKTLTKLSDLSIKQEELFRQSIKCTEYQLYRAAVVLSWAAFMDFLQELVVSKGFTLLKSKNKKFEKCENIDDLREYISDSTIIDTAFEHSIITKNQKKALIGLLNKRNEAAHPSDYPPDINQTLGYISELLQRIDNIKTKLKNL